MAIIINGGPMGRGVCIEQPNESIIIDGIHALAPDPDGHYSMGHINY
jgi:hypothetical protein